MDEPCVVLERLTVCAVVYIPSIGEATGVAAAPFIIKDHALDTREGLPARSMAAAAGTVTATVPTAATTSRV
jgi:hypothetical protein